MSKPRLRSSEKLALLKVLSTRVRAGAGWGRKGVRGWIFTDEFPSSLAVEHLRELEQGGFLAREDVSDPFRGVPLYLNRITQSGENEVALHEQRDPASIPGPRGATLADGETIYVPRGAWDALAALARAPESDAWRSLSEIAERAGTPIDPTEVEFLVSRNLASVRRPAVVGPRTPLLYSATALGRRARARDTKTSQARVQIRVRGLSTTTE
jgi:hypothetical protein